MRALIKLGAGPGEMVVGDLPEPAPGPDEIVIRVAACGICGTDLSLYHGSASLVEQMRPIFPLVIGHEFAGEVVELGSQVSGLERGQWVVVNPHLFCGACTACLRGEEEICSNRPIISFHRPGGAAEYVSVRATNAYPLPADVAASVGALGEPLSVAVHAVERVPPGAAETVLVVGAGPIALLIGIACQEVGCGSLLLSGLAADAPRLRIAEKLGIDVAVAGPELDDRVRDLTGGAGVDIVYEAGGSVASLVAGLTVLRKGGRLSALGIPATAVPVDVAALVLSEKSVIGTRGYTPRSWSRAVAVLTKRRKDLEALVTHRLALEDFEQAMALLETREGAKIFLVP